MKHFPGHCGWNLEMQNKRTKMDGAKTVQSVLAICEFLEWFCFQPPLQRRLTLFSYAELSISWQASLAARNRVSGSRSFPRDQIHSRRTSSMAAHSLGPAQHLLLVMNRVCDSPSGGGTCMMWAERGRAAALPSSTAAQQGRPSVTLYFFLENLKLFPLLSTHYLVWPHPAYATCFSLAFQHLLLSLVALLALFINFSFSIESFGSPGSLLL